MLVFCEKMSKWAICSFTHFWWATWALHSHRSLKKREWANLSIFFLTDKKRNKNHKKYDFSQTFLSELLVFCEGKNEWAIRWKKEWFAHSLIYHEWPEQIAHGRSFVMSSLRDLLTVYLLTWETWVICSQLLICPGRSEWISHSPSFHLSDFRKWAMSEWAMSEWSNSQP